MKRLLILGSLAVCVSAALGLARASSIARVATQDAAASGQASAAPAAKPSAFEEELKKLGTKWRAARRDYDKALRKGADRATLVDPASEYAQKARELATRARGDAAQPEALLLALDILRGDRAGSTYDACLAEAPLGVLEERIAQRLSKEWRHVLGSELVEQRLAALAARELPAQARAAATFALASSLMQPEAAPDSKPSMPGESSAATTPEREAAARKHLEAVRKDGTGTIYAARANELLFKYEHLAIGTIADDIQAVDENGKPWKLSDYRGKVVIVDFWGHW